MVLAEFDPQFIIVLVMVVLAGVKALIEKLQEKAHPPVTGEDYEGPETIETDYEEYARQLRERQAEIAAQQRAALETAPPPLPSAIPVALPVAKKVPSRFQEKPALPKLSAAEKRALENLKKSQNLPRRPSSPGTTARARAKRVLSSPHAARDAIVLSEILGTPKGLR
ncbi:MAG: hypothetical protein ACSHYF_02395 [Verrucomicrobiaceae bacterium]